MAVISLLSVGQVPKVWWQLFHWAPAKSGFEKIQNENSVVFAGIVHLTILTNPKIPPYKKGCFVTAGHLCKRQGFLLQFACSPQGVRSQIQVFFPTKWVKNKLALHQQGLYSLACCYQDWNPHEGIGSNSDSETCSGRKSCCARRHWIEAILQFLGLMMRAMGLSSSDKAWRGRWNWWTAEQVWDGRREPTSTQAWQCDRALLKGVWVSDARQQSRNKICPHHTRHWHVLFKRRSLFS